MINISEFRVFPQYVKRYLSVAPRVTVMSGTIGTVSLDSATNGIYRFTYSLLSGSHSNTLSNMSIDIGTSAGLNDLGTYRIRKPADVTYIYIEEISVQQSGIQSGVHFSIKRDFRPSSIKPRIVPSQINTQHLTNFTEYHDYDIAHTIQNEQIKPKANITESGSYTSGTLINAKPAGFVDTNQIYRTVNLSSSNSVAFGVSASISSRTWDVQDGTITVGSSSSTDITVRFPVGFRWITLTVTDNNGRQDTMFFPIWVHDNNNLPITKFKRNSDTTESWRDVSFSFWGNDNEFPESVIPKGGLVCYWEIPYFAGNPMPDEYISHALLYVKTETESLKMYEPEMEMQCAGIGWWLSQARTYSQYLRDKTTATYWGEIKSLTSKRALQYFLREYSTCYLIANLFPKMSDYAVKEYNVPANDVWSQIKYLAEGDELREVACDSLGGIWITKPGELMNATERASWIVRVELETQDMLGESPIAYTNEFIQKVALSKGGAFSYNGTTSTTYLAQAPSKAEGYALSSDEMPNLFLGTSNTQQTLNQILGDWWAKQNNPTPQIDIVLFSNMDVCEPAYGEIIKISYFHDSLRGTVINELPCRLIRVSRNNDEEKGFNEVTWTLMPITDGEDADSVPVPPVTEYQAPDLDLPIDNIFPDSYIPPSYTDVASPIFPPPPTPPSIYNPDPIFYVAAITYDKKILITANFTNESPTWTPSTLTMNGNIVQAQADPFSPFYLGTGTEINIVVVTTERIYTVNDIYNAQTVTSRFTFSETSPLRSLSISQGFEKNAVVTSLYDDRTTITTSTNLTSWTTESDYGTIGLDGCTDHSTAEFSVNSATYNGGNGVSSGVSVTLGDTLSWEALGTWRAEPTGTYTYFVDANGYGVTLGSTINSSLSLFALLWRVGTSGAWSLAGTSGTATAPSSGTVYFIANDQTFAFGNNTGSLDVTLTIESPCTSGNIPETESSPGAYNSAKVNGRVYASGTNLNLGFVSTDNGANMNLASTVTPTRAIDGINSLIGDIGIPQKGNTSSEIIGFYGRTSSLAKRFIRFSGLTATDISPISSGVTYGPYKSGQISCNPLQTGKIIVCGINYHRTKVGVWESINNGGEWLVVQAPVADSGTGRYERATYASASSQIMYLWGTKGKIGLGRKSTAWTIDEKTGDINQATTGEIINIFVAGEQV